MGARTAINGPWLNRASFARFRLVFHHRHFAVQRRRCCSHLSRQNDAEIKAADNVNVAERSRYFGQAAPSTHPHLLHKGEVTPGLTVDEFRQRRFRLMEAIENCNSKAPIRTDHHLVVLPSAVKSFMSENIPYPFHQNTNFLYMSGFKEADSVLVLHSPPEASLPSHKSTIFVPRRDPQTELWDGPRSGTDGAVQLLGIDESFETDRFDAHLNKIGETSRENFVVWYDVNRPFNEKVHKTIVDFLKRFPRASCRSPRTLIQSLRVIKSSAEIALMKRACEIASEAFVRVMSSQSTSESELHARMEYECRIRGAEYLAYPPVVAGGSRANIIHYINNNQRIEDDELVLMDAGCYLHGYVSDISRTWPVGGKFSNAQRVVYEAVLDIQMKLLKYCHQQVTLDQLHRKLTTLLSESLQQMGIISAKLTAIESLQAVQKYCPHHVSHYLGMDVHDSALIPRSLPLQPGMVFTVEPGIYISENNRDVPAEFRGIGIRIEDNVLMTDAGPLILSCDCPKDVNEIEKIVSSLR